MELKVVTVSLMAAGVLLAGCAGSGDSKSSAAAGSELGRQVLAANDGWAAVGGGVDGGAKATASNIFTVSNRAELVKALGVGNAPKIIYVKGTINLSVDDNNKELFEKDYAEPGYNFDAYVKAYAPATWNQKLEKGRPVRKLTGPLEEARDRSAEKQKKRIVINVSSNTSIIGVGKDAKIVKGNLMIGNGTENVIIRNIEFQDAFDYFPAWDPGDSWRVDSSYPGCQEQYVDATKGPQLCPGGRWNSEYDNISINGGKRVWIDHCTFNDGDRPDTKFPPVYPFPHNQVEQKVQHHDGLVDITNGGDFVTLSYNVFKDHDKTSLIGGSDSLTSDAGKLNATYRHNWFENSGQRLPRVRFGKISSYNNVFIGDAAGNSDSKLSLSENHLAVLKLAPKHNIFRGALAVGKDGAIFSENNVFEIKNGGAEFAFIQQGGTKFTDKGSMVNGKPADLVAARKAADPKAKIEDAGFTPVYPKAPLPTADVKAHVQANAGAGKL